LNQDDDHLQQLQGLEGFDSLEEHTALSGTAGFMPLQQHLLTNV
jgi:hypothetical protein